ncbi:MAG: beta-hydroxyacyl-ACP dehydratase, partial [Prevotella sp.]
YVLLDEQKINMSGVFHIRLCKDCPVYEGHFPHFHVAPGVFNMQLVKDCCERLVNYPLSVTAISRCRMLRPVVPGVADELYVVINLTMKKDGYDCDALIEDGTHKYMEYKGEMLVE